MRWTELNSNFIIKYISNIVLAFTYKERGW